MELIGITCICGPQDNPTPKAAKRTPRTPTFESTYANIHEALRETSRSFTALRRGSDRNATGEAAASTSRQRIGIPCGHDDDEDDDEDDEEDSDEFDLDLSTAIAASRISSGIPVPKKGASSSQAGAAGTIKKAVHSKSLISQDSLQTPKRKLKTEREVKKEEEGTTSTQEELVDVMTIWSKPLGWFYLPGEKIVKIK